MDRGVDWFFRSGWAGIGLAIFTVIGAWLVSEQRRPSQGLGPIGPNQYSQKSPTEKNIQELPKEKNDFQKKGHQVTPGPGLVLFKPPAMPMLDTKLFNDTQKALHAGTVQQHDDLRRSIEEFNSKTVSGDAGIPQRFEELASAYEELASSLAGADREAVQKAAQECRKRGQALRREMK